MNNEVVSCQFCGKLIHYCWLGNGCQFAGWIHRHGSHYCGGRKHGHYPRIATPRRADLAAVIPRPRGGEYDSPAHT